MKKLSDNIKFPPIPPAPKYSSDDIKKAFMDLMSGNNDGDIECNTGLPPARCSEIYQIYKWLTEKTIDN